MQRVAIKKLTAAITSGAAATSAVQHADNRQSNNNNNNNNGVSLLFKANEDNTLTNNDITLLSTTIQKIKPSEKEVDSALESIKENPDIIESKFPGYMSMDANIKNILTDSVRDLLLNDKIINTYCQKLKSSDNNHDDDSEYDIVMMSEHDNNDSELSSIESLQYGIHPYTQDTSTIELASNDWSMKWEAAVDKYPCSLCKDLLAAPTILNCSHSYCGMCLSNMIESCNVCNNDDEPNADDKSNIEVEYQCPLCKEPIITSIYERLLDQDIQRLTDAIPDCEPKRDWKQRRSQYIQATKLKNGTDTNKKSGLSRLLAGDWGARSHNEGDDEGATDWTELCHVVVPIFAFAVLALITVVRSFK